MISIRSIKNEDMDILAKMNLILIEDEGHHNTMNVSELRDRMNDWLKIEYHAAIIEVDEEVAGYSLWRENENGYYIRQYFIGREFRRRGIGRKGIDLLKSSYWAGKVLQLEVLITNQRGRSFWQDVGFTDYCMVMKCDNV